MCLCFLLQQRLKNEALDRLWHSPLFYNCLNWIKYFLCRVLNAADDDVMDDEKFTQQNYIYFAYEWALDTNIERERD